MASSKFTDPDGQAVTLACRYKSSDALSRSKSTYLTTGSASGSALATETIFESFASDSSAWSQDLAGLYTFTCTAYDTLGLSQDQDFTLAVSPNNPVTVAGSIAD